MDRTSEGNREINSAPSELLLPDRCGGFFRDVALGSWNELELKKLSLGPRIAANSWSVGPWNAFGRRTRASFAGSTSEIEWLRDQEPLLDVNITCCV